MKEEMKCPFHHGESMEVHVGSNVDAKDPVRSWWPDSLNLDVLAQQDQKINPNDADFNYRREFEKIDYQALKEDIKKVISKLTPDESKHVSRELSRFVRDDWGNVKYNFME